MKIKGSVNPCKAPFLASFYKKKIQESASLKYKGKGKIRKKIRAFFIFQRE